jgi:hypothetical protein
MYAFWHVHSQYTLVNIKMIKKLKFILNSLFVFIYLWTRCPKGVGLVRRQIEKYGHAQSIWQDERLGYWGCLSFSSRICRVCLPLRSSQSQCAFKKTLYLVLHFFSNFLNYLPVIWAGKWSLRRRMAHNRTRAWVWCESHLETYLEI